MFFNAFRQQTLASALPPPREGGTSAFRFHPRAKSVLTFARAFGWLKSAFHNGTGRCEPTAKAPKLRTGAPLSMLAVNPIGGQKRHCHSRRFLK
jgi:hypothetical protein